MGIHYRPFGSIISSGTLCLFCRGLNKKRTRKPKRFFKTLAIQLQNSNITIHSTEEGSFKFPPLSRY